MTLRPFVKDVNTSFWLLLGYGLTEPTKPTKH